MDPSTKLCMGCMNELGSDGRCHYCSYTDDIPHLQAYLAPRTVLDNRYIVGKCFHIMVRVRLTFATIWLANASVWQESICLTLFAKEIAKVSDLW